MKKAVWLLLIYVVCSILLTEYAGAATDSAKKLVIVCSTTQIADFTRQVVGIGAGRQNG